MTDEKFPVILQSTWIHKTTLSVYTVSQIVTSQFKNQNTPVTRITGDSHADGTVLTLSAEDWQKHLVPVPDVELNCNHKYYLYQADTPSNAVECCDAVHQPSHYKLDGLDVEWMDVRSALLRGIPVGYPYEAVTSWSEAITYLARMWGKNGVEDAQKALVYTSRLVQILQTGKASGTSELQA